MIRIIKNVHVFAPEDVGIKDVLVATNKVIKIADKIEMDSDEEFLETIDGSGLYLFPGLIDGHVHILGGGGEGGYKTRTPELAFSDLVKGGVTTVVGCLGTDGVARSMESLVAKAYGIREEGISAYIYSGSYRLPLKTVTDSIQKDIMMIEPIIGVGEIAISDHRSSAPTIDEFLKVASDARVGGILSGKAGLVNVHLGDGKQMLEFLEYAKLNTEIPLTQFLPTHANRNRELFEVAIQYAKDGGYIDFTTSTVPQFIEEGEVPASEAFLLGLKAGVDKSHMTFTSDGQGSLPLFNESGEFLGLDVGRVTSLYESMCKLHVTYALPLEIALLPVTKNPAKLLKLHHKGRVFEGGDADLLLVDKVTLQISGVMAMGNWLKKDNVIIKKGTFE